MKNVIILNCSPRKNFNTAMLLKEAKKGVLESGASVEYFDLYDYDYKGCRSCFACQIKNSKTNNLCAINDSIRPILEKCIASDAIILGTPVYFSYPSGMFRSFIERLLFSNHSYMVDENGKSIRKLKKIIPTGIIFTMNCPKDLMEKLNYKIILEENVKAFNHIMGYCESLYSYDTYQFLDYSKYDVNMFDEKHKKSVRDNVFPKDLESAFLLGKKLTNFN